MDAESIPIVQNHIVHQFNKYTQYTTETVPRLLVTATASYHNKTVPTKNEPHHHHDLDASDHDRECLSTGASEVAPVAHGAALFHTGFNSDGRNHAIAIAISICTSGTQMASLLGRKSDIPHARTISRQGKEVCSRYVPLSLGSGFACWTP